MGLLGPTNNEFTADDVRANLEEGDMGREEAAIYGVTLAQEAYRNGDMTRDEFHKYVDQAEEVALTGQGDVAIPEVEASIEGLRRGHFDSYNQAREAVADAESLQEVDLVAVPGPQNLGVGVNMADELDTDYTLMIAEDKESNSLGPNVDSDSVKTIRYGKGGHDIELHGDDIEDKVTAIGGASWGRNMIEADTFYDAPKRRSEKAFRAVMEDGSVGSEIGAGRTFGEFVKDTLGL